MENKKIIIGVAIAAGVGVLTGLGIYLYKHWPLCGVTSHS